MTTKPVCQLDPMGYYIGLTYADESPLEPGTFLLPAGCIEADAPVVQLGQRARWVHAAWVIEIVPEAEPEPTLSADQLRAIALADIEQRRDDALRAGVVLDGTRYHSDDRFLTELLGMVMGYQAGVYAPTDQQGIRTMDNTVVQLGAQQITALASAVGAHRRAVYAQSWAEKDAL